MSAIDFEAIAPAVFDYLSHDVGSVLCYNREEYVGILCALRDVVGCKIGCFGVEYMNGGITGDRFPFLIQYIKFYKEVQTYSNIEGRFSAPIQTFMEHSVVDLSHFDTSYLDEDDVSEMLGMF